MSSSLERLRNTETIHDLSALINYKSKSITYILYVMNEAEKYTEFKIPKSSGGYRNILSPESKLKSLQKNLTQLLHSCYNDFLYAKSRRRNPAHGFLKNRSIGTNSSPHKNCEWVLNIDIENFFDSINFGRVRGFLMSNEGFSLKEPIATRIAQICCYKNSLPQGAPTSPIISNLIGTYLDSLMLRLASKHHLRYTRYADDITLSLRKGDFPVGIAEFRGNDLILGNELLKAIKKSGFSINNRKSRLQHRSQRQMVTGLVTNRRVNVTSEFRKKVRAMVHRYTMNQTIWVDTADGKEEISGKNAANKLSGYLGFIYWIDSLYGGQGVSSVYKEFILHTRFFNNDMPVILCEGETDVIYFREAIKHLASEFPLLADIKSDHIELKVEFYNYKNRKMNELLGLGGCPQLIKLLDVMAKMTKKFQRKGNAQPVVIVVDDDKDGKDVIKKFEKLKNNFGDFYQPERFNVKVLKIEGPAGTETTVVEDLLPKSLLDKQADGRSFARQEDFDRALYYGKKELAEKVFFPRRREVDFSYFKKTLEKIEQSIRGR